MTKAQLYDIQQWQEFINVYVSEKWAKREIKWIFQDSYNINFRLIFKSKKEKKKIFLELTFSFCKCSY